MAAWQEAVTIGGMGLANIAEQALKKRREQTQMPTWLPVAGAAVGAAILLYAIGSLAVGDNEPAARDGNQAQVIIPSGNNSPAATASPAGSGTTASRPTAATAIRPGSSTSNPDQTPQGRPLTQLNSPTGPIDVPQAAADLATQVSELLVGAGEDSEAVFGIAANRLDGQLNKLELVDWDTEGEEATRLDLVATFDTASGIALRRITIAKAGSTWQATVTS